MKKKESDSKMWKKIVGEECECVICNQKTRYFKDFRKKASTLTNPKQEEYWTEDRGVYMTSEKIVVKNGVICLDCLKRYEGWKVEEKQ